MFKDFTLKKLVPFEKLVLVSNLSPEELTEQIKKETQPKKFFQLAGVFTKSGHKIFEGDVEGNTFTITRIIHYKNSFIPTVYGSIYPSSIGSEIKIKLKPHIFVQIFMTFWLGMVGIGSIVSLISMLSENIQVFNFIPFGMFLFGCTLFVGAFKYESSKTKKVLKDLIQAEEKNEDQSSGSAIQRF